MIHVSLKMKIFHICKSYSYFIRTRTISIVVKLLLVIVTKRSLLDYLYITVHSIIDFRNTSLRILFVMINFFLLRKDNETKKNLLNDL